jgi:hypothetical protein
MTNAAGAPVRRADVLRRALELGIAALEDKYPAPPSPKTKRRG